MRLADAANDWRRHPDSNRGCGFCKPVPYHLAMPPHLNSSERILGILTAQVNFRWKVLSKNPVLRPPTGDCRLRRVGVGRRVWPQDQDRAQESPLEETWVAVMGPPGASGADPETPGFPDLAVAKPGFAGVVTAAVPEVEPSGRPPWGRMPWIPRGWFVPRAIYR